MHGVEKRLCLGSLPGEKLRGLKTTMLLVEVVAHPTAHYTLSVMVK